MCVCLDEFNPSKKLKVEMKRKIVTPNGQHEPAKAAAGEPAKSAERPE